MICIGIIYHRSDLWSDKFQTIVQTKERSKTFPDPAIRAYREHVRYRRSSDQGVTSVWPPWPGIASFFSVFSERVELLEAWTRGDMEPTVFSLLPEIHDIQEAFAQMVGNEGLEDNETMRIIESFILNNTVKIEFLRDDLKAAELDLQVAKAKILKIEESNLGIKLNEQFEDIADLFDYIYYIEQSLAFNISLLELVVSEIDWDLDDAFRVIDVVSNKISAVEGRVSILGADFGDLILSQNERLNRIEYKLTQNKINATNNSRHLKFNLSELTTDEQTEKTFKTIEMYLNAVTERIEEAELQISDLEAADFSTQIKFEGERITNLESDVSNKLAFFHTSVNGLKFVVNQNAQLLDSFGNDIDEIFTVVEINVDKIAKMEDADYDKMIDDLSSTVEKYVNCCAGDLRQDNQVQSSSQNDTNRSSGN